MDLSRTVPSGHRRNLVVSQSFIRSRNPSYFALWECLTIYPQEVTLNRLEWGLP